MYCVDGPTKTTARKGSTNDLDMCPGCSGAQIACGEYDDGLSETIKGITTTTIEATQSCRTTKQFHECCS